MAALHRARRPLLFAIDNMFPLTHAALRARSGMVVVLRRFFTCFCGIVHTLGAVGCMGEDAHGDPSRVIIFGIFSMRKGKLHTS